VHFEQWCVCTIFSLLRLNTINFERSRFWIQVCAPPLFKKSRGSLGGEYGLVWEGPHYK
jgi:hypothetical protein